MTTEQIVENNKLIAEFMSLKQVNWNGEGMVWVNKDFKEDFTHVDDYSNNSKFDWANSLPNAENLLYHTSWDWLMPVIGKISNGCEEPEELDGLKYALLTNNINESWRFVVEFIKWYNNK